MKKTLFILLAAAAFAGCTSTVSKNVRADGSVGELVWPTQKDSWRDEALRLPSPTIASVKVGLERKNVFALLDVPHFSEINGAREWNYILQRPEYTRENQAVCHLKLIYGDDDRIAALYWLPEDCATVYGEPVAPYRLAAWENVLITGDYNCTPEAPQLRILHEHGYQRLGDTSPTFPSWKPQKALDHAFLKGKLHARSFVGNERDSDHLPRVIELTDIE